MEVAFSACFQSTEWFDMQLNRVTRLKHTWCSLHVELVMIPIRERAIRVGEIERIICRLVSVAVMDAIFSLLSTWLLVTWLSLDICPLCRLKQASGINVDGWRVCYNLESKDLTGPHVCFSLVYPIISLSTDDFAIYDHSEIFGMLALKTHACRSTHWCMKSNIRTRRSHVVRIVRLESDVYHFRSSRSRLFTQSGAPWCPHSTRRNMEYFSYDW